MTGQWRANLFGQTRGCKTNKFCRVRNFTCRSAPSRQIDLLIDCRRPGARVTWRNGAPVGSCVYTYSCHSSRPTDGEALSFVESSSTTSPRPRGVQTTVRS